MGVLKALGETLFKMFMADFALTAGALASVGLAAGALKIGLIGPGPLPFLIAAGILTSLVAGVLRGARR